MDRENSGRLLVVLCLIARTIVGRPRESVLKVRMALWIALISLSARLTSLDRIERIASFSVRSPSGGRRTETPAQLGRAIDSVLGMELFVFRRSCWKRALVLHRFLRLSGIESRVSFGVRKTIDGTVTGHAWVEHQGRPFLEDHAGSYVVTFSLPRARSSGMVPLERGPAVWQRR